MRKGRMGEERKEGKKRERTHTITIALPIMDTVVAMMTVLYSFHQKRIIDINSNKMKILLSPSSLMAQSADESLEVSNNTE